MSESGLRPALRVAESDWLVPRLRAFGSAVAAVVPDGFPAYVRILHPARGANGSAVSWAEVAAWSGRTMHRLVQFHAMSQLPLSSAAPPPWNGDPEPGNLPGELLRVLCAILSRHTDREMACYFCLWEGYGWLQSTPAFGLPRVSFPKRKYVLFEGPLPAATALGWTLNGTFIAQSPNVFWPRDRAWCVASEIDLFCTLVGGSEALAEALVASSVLEAWRVQPGDPISYDSDKVNT